MGQFCSTDKKSTVEPIVKPGINPDYDHTVIGDFVPQQEGDLKVNKSESVSVLILQAIKSLSIPGEGLGALKLSQILEVRLQKTTELINFRLFDN